MLRDEIAKVINEDAAYSKNKANFRTQLCFAIKPGINGLLDVARKTYLETSEGAGAAIIPIVILRRHSATCARPARATRHAGTPLAV